MMHQRTFDEYHPYPEINTTNRPEVYTPFGNAFDLYPIPNAVYTMYIRTIQWPTVISSTSSAIDYFPDKDDIIVSCMTSDGFKHLQMFEDGVLWENEYIKLIREAISVDTRYPDYEPVGRGFDSNYDLIYLGDYWNQTDVMRNP
jgi:hypothetical protein